jgi:hypothetical protein
MKMMKPVRHTADDDDDVSNNSDGQFEETVELSSSISVRHHADHSTAPEAPHHQQQEQLPRAPQSGHIPSPANGVRSLSDDGVNRRILASPLLRHRHYQQQQHNRRQQSSGSSVPTLPNNTTIQHHRRQQQSQPKQWNNNNIMMIQGSHSLDDADIAAGAAQLRASRAWLTTTSPSSRSLGSHTPPSFSRHLNYLDGVEYHDAPLEQSMERGGYDRKEGSSRNHYLYGGSEHDFLALPPDNEDDDDDEYDDKDGLQQHLLHRNPLRDFHHPPYGLPSIEGSPDIVALNNRRQKMQLLSSSANANGNINNNEDAQYITAVLPPKPPLFSSFEDTAATSQMNAATSATTTATHSATSTASTTKLFVVLGWDLTTYSRRSQFLISAGGTFLFSLIYGYLQELISVSLCNRKLGLFLALAQFTGYTILSYFFRRLDMSGGGGGATGGLIGTTSASVGGGMGGGGGGSTFFSRKFRRLNNWGKLRGGLSSSSTSSSTDQSTSLRKSIPIELYIGLSVLRAIDLGMTNLAMQYVNYPAKTIMKSTRVVWTMLFGVIVSKKRYGMADFGIVGLMVAGLGLFMHADSHTSAVFQPIGIIMLIISLLGDGAISNLSEALMNQYEVGQDEFIFRLYSIATFFIFLSAAVKGDLRDGLAYLTRPGTMKEIEDDLDPTWSILAKILTLVLFSTTGFLGSSCSAAITKSFGALTMSITSTARKATTIFLSFALFPSNKCTLEHIGGIFLFIASLVAKSVRESKRRHNHHHHQFHHHSAAENQHNPTAVRSSVLPPVIMEIVNMSGSRGTSRKNKSSPNIGSPLQLRHKVSGDDAV